MSTIRDRRLHAIAGLTEAIKGIDGLLLSDLPPLGFPWSDLYTDLETAVAVLRSAEEENER